MSHPSRILSVVCAIYHTRHFSFDILRFFPPFMATAAMYSGDMASHHHTHFHAMNDMRACVCGYLSLPIFGMYSIDTVEASISLCVVRVFTCSMNNTWSNNHCSHEMMAVSLRTPPRYFMSIRSACCPCVRASEDVCMCMCDGMWRFVCCKISNIACSAGEMWKQAKRLCW